MNRQEFYEKFHALNPRLMWEVNGPKRSGEKTPIFKLKGYSINGYIIIFQEWPDGNGQTHYYPSMNNNYDETFSAIKQISSGIKPYYSRNGDSARAVYDGNIYGSYTLFVDGKPEIILQCGEDEAGDYTMYVNAKLDIDEDPLTLEQWRDFNESSK